MRKQYTAEEFIKDAKKLGDIIADFLSADKTAYEGIYGVPRGGCCLATYLSQKLKIPLVSDIKNRNDILVVDDIIDSGKTRKRFEGKDFAVIHCKADPNRLNSIRGRTYFVHKIDSSVWVDYFWEQGTISTAEEIITRQIELIGDNPNRKGLIDTPRRVAKAWKEMFSGYSINPSTLFTSFDAERYDQIVVVKDIDFFSTCEHHLLPFLGRAHVAYIPNKQIIGASKIPRLVEAFSRRLQIQERLGDQIVESLMRNLKPKGAACILEAHHLCMMLRGIKKKPVMITSSMKGIFLENSDKGRAARQELMAIISAKSIKQYS